MIAAKVWNHTAQNTFRSHLSDLRSRLSDLPLSWLGLAVIGLGIGTILGTYSHVIEVLGRRIPHDDILQSYVIALGWSLLIGASIVFWPVPATHRPVLLLAWTMRCCITLVFMPLTEYSATVEELDAFRYYIWAESDFIRISDMQIGDGTFNVSRLIALHNEVFPDSFRMLVVSWSAIGLIASYIFYRASVIVMGRDGGIVLIVNLFLPSILYWSSVLGKDPIQYLAVSLYTYGFVLWAKGSEALTPKILVLAGVLGAMMIRTWYGPMLVIPLLIFVVWSLGDRERSPVAKLTALGGLSMGVMLAFRNSQYFGALETSEGLLGSVNEIHQGYASGGSAIEASSYSSITDVLFSLPTGIPTALFRPLPGEVLNIFGVMAGLENLVVLCFAIVAITRLSKSALGSPVMIWAISTVALWSVMYALTASTNLGTLARYRLQIQPILWCLILYVSFYQQLSNVPRHSQR